MRRYSRQGAFSVNAVSGTYVVIVGINAKEAAVTGLLSFAIHRTDHTEDKQLERESSSLLFKRTNTESTQKNGGSRGLLLTATHPLH